MQHGVYALETSDYVCSLFPAAEIAVPLEMVSPTPSHPHYLTHSQQKQLKHYAWVFTTMGNTLSIIFYPLWQGFGSDSGGGGNHDDDDAESVTSECSTFSISSEVSVSPYVRYPHPITVSLSTAHQIVHTVIRSSLAVGFVLKKGERKDPSPPSICYQSFSVSLWRAHFWLGAKYPFPSTCMTSDLMLFSLSGGKYLVVKVLINSTSVVGWPSMGGGNEG